MKTIIDPNVEGVPSKLILNIFVILLKFFITAVVTKIERTNTIPTSAPMRMPSNSTTVERATHETSKADMQTGQGKTKIKKVLFDISQPACHFFIVAMPPNSKNKANVMCMAEASGELIKEVTSIASMKYPAIRDMPKYKRHKTKTVFHPVFENPHPAPVFNPKINTLDKIPITIRDAIASMKHLISFVHYIKSSFMLPSVIYLDNVASAVVEDDFRDQWQQQTESATNKQITPTEIQNFGNPSSRADLEKKSWNPKPGLKAV